MLTYILAFLAGNLCIQTQAKLLENSDACCLSLITLGIAIWYPRKIIRHVFAFSLGLAYTTIYANHLLAWSLPQAIEGKPISIHGYIASLPTIDAFGQQFEFATIQTRMRIRWQHPSQTLRVGDEWQLNLRLKRIHGIQSPGAMDFEAWALERGLRATGYVIAHTKNQFIAHHPYRYPIEYLRQYLQVKIQAHLPHTPTAPWLMALMIGERSDIPAQYWEVLRNTGTNHLMAIGGLHIGILAGFVYCLTNWCWRRWPILLIYLPASHAAAIAALSMALIYSAIAGFSLPTQRACIMLTVFMAAILAKRKIHAWHAWSLALGIVLVINPLSTLDASFYLSFGTIALLIYGMGGRLMTTGLWHKWGQAQWIIGIGLIPLSLSFFQESSIVSFVANSIAIPWLEFLILPFCLLSQLCLLIAPTMTDFLLLLADKSLSVLWLILTWLSQSHFAIWQQAILNNVILLLTTLGLVLLILPPGARGRYLGIPLLIPLIFHHPPQPVFGELWLTLLDVGQGLSVVIRTQHHTLVYDAGPKFASGIDMGANVVLPYLRLQGIKQLDKLVISHGDNDHIGGAATLLHALPINAISTSTPQKLSSYAAQYCLAGETWWWDGIVFRFLYPARENLQNNNDSSCVLQITTATQRYLLTGDIEKLAEHALLEKMPQQLAANLLIAPHHGSKTSGVPAFIAAVQPQYVFYATGYKNRYHFPHPSVVAAYKSLGAQQFATAASGTIEMKSGVIHEYRIWHRRYWMT